MRREVTDGGIHCPYCGCTFSSVVNTEQIMNGIKRRRECQECGMRYNSFEYSANEERSLRQRQMEVEQITVNAQWAIQNAIEKLQQIKI